mmetsp:Transcript_12576/g.14188  ORF Transcript_12576/g.14188 Transcript_12576/m.14188 type:complete len:133 (-) Transcript_12576:113-511(-)
MAFSNTATAFVFSPALSGIAFWIRTNSWFGSTIVLNGGQEYVILRSITTTTKTTATTISNKDNLPVKITEKMTDYNSFSTKQQQGALSRIRSRFYDDVQDYIESSPVFKLLPNSNKTEFDESFLDSMIKCIL